MRRVLRWLGYALAAILWLLLLFAAWLWFASARVLGRVHEAAPERLAQPTAAQLADGARQLRVLGCANCHGARLQGQLMFDGGPFAKVWAPNLTELAPRVSDQQLAAAIRQGIGNDGRALFIMPSEVFSRQSDQEVAALIAAIRAAPRAGGPVPAIQWGPVGRFALATGNLRSTRESVADYRARRPLDTGPGEAAGRRLAATTCAACHGPDLSGGAADPAGPAPPDLAIAGAYDLAQFRTLMRTGVPPGGRDLGIMKEVAERDFANYTDEEVGRLYAYLRARAQRTGR
ncbi:MAG TPA: cytochrome c [Allosphingosinicella sp.]|nr:cytochrome c [Allosphingosinicella sp.]